MADIKVVVEVAGLNVVVETSPTYSFFVVKNVVVTGT